MDIRKLLIVGGGDLCMQLLKLLMPVASSFFISLGVIWKNSYAVVICFGWAACS